MLQIINVFYDIQQVADMHGELIELNERLQKMLNIREHQLRRLREELVDLRGPVVHL